MVACSVLVRRTAGSSTTPGLLRLLSLTYTPFALGSLGRRSVFGVIRAYSSCTITIPFHPWRVLWGHGRYCRACWKCQQGTHMFLKLGQTLAKEGKDASSVVTSSIEMMVSIVKVDCHVKSETVRSNRRSFVVCTMMGANQL
jgi:hypothetical protein